MNKQNKKLSRKLKLARKPHWFKYQSGCFHNPAYYPAVGRLMRRFDKGQIPDYVEYYYRLPFGGEEITRG